MDKLSQSSALSPVSTIPPDLIASQDDDFLDELERVNDLYFGNVQVSEDTGITSSVDSDDYSDTDSENGSTAEDVVRPELREEDVPEQHAQSTFQTNTGGCIRLYGQACSNVVDWDALLEYRNHCLETSHTELDLMIKIQLYHHRKSGSVTESKKHRSKQREKPRQEYFFNRRQMCRDTFSFAHGVNRKKIDTIARSLDIDGLIPRTHGHAGKSPKHACIDCSRCAEYKIVPYFVWKQIRNASAW